jgi:outer membrane protein TolC
VDDAQTSLVQTRGNLAQARRDYIVALVNLEWVKGTLGENREVQSSMLKIQNIE